MCCLLVQHFSLHAAVLPIDSKPCCFALVNSQMYDEEPLGGTNCIRQDNRSLSENWSGVGLDHDGLEDDEVAFSDFDNHNTFSSSNSELHLSSSNEHLRNRRACRNHPSFLQPTALAADGLIRSTSRMTDLTEFKVVTTCNTCKPATINHGDDAKSLKNPDCAVPLSNYHPTVAAFPRTRHKGPHILSWLLPKSKRKPRPDVSPSTVECENMSQLLKDWGVFSLDSLKKEVVEANEHRDAALQEVSEMKLSLGELTTKIASLEAYCSELKKALKQATSAKSMQSHHSKRSSTRSVSGSPLPVSHEVMVEGFVQVVSEARLSVKQFCKALIQQVEEDADNGLSEKLNLLLQPYQITLGDKRPKLVLYHLEALMNQAMYQDFENCAFQKNGPRRCLDPRQERQESFASFVALRNLSWSEVLRKGTRHHCKELSRFCDQKMGCVASALMNWSRPCWAEPLLQCFFVACKCVWLLHLLAFSFSPPLAILRVEEGRAFEQTYMEDVLLDMQRSQDHEPPPSARVKLMVVPGFYVQDRLLKCRVLCSYISG
jgi:hypothetical protein